MDRFRERIKWQNPELSKWEVLYVGLPEWYLLDLRDDSFYDEVEYFDRWGGRWEWSAGEEGDVCIGCNRDISDRAGIFLNSDYSSWRFLCRGCAGMVD